MPIYHKHHIIPKHMGGTDDPSNLVSVTVEEHANLHKQLWEDLGHEEDRIAWQGLSGQITMKEASKHAHTLGSRKGGLKLKGRPKTDSHKEKLKLASIGQIPWNVGKKHSDETIKKIKEARSRQIITEETRRKISSKHLGMKRTDETRKNISESLKVIVQCSHCQIYGGKGAMMRWHFNNCRRKKC